MSSKNKNEVNVNEAELMELGKFYFLNNKHDEAIAEFEKIIAINSKNAEAYYNIGLIKETRNDFAGAKDMYSQALNIEPDYKAARERLNKLIGLEDE